MSLKKLHACWSKGLVSDFLCLKRREGEKRTGLLSRRGWRRRWNWLGLGLLDFDLDLVQGWWAWTRWGLRRAGVGGVPGSSLTGNNERWTKEFNTDEDFSQSVTVSQLLKGLGCGHPLCARLPCSAHHACGRRCQGEFNLIVFSTFVKMSNSFVWNRFSCGNIDRKEFENLTCPLALLQAKSLDGANPWCPAEPNLPWMLVSKRLFPRNCTHCAHCTNCTTQLQKQLSTGGWWCWCHFSPCSENYCGGLFKGNQLEEFLEFFDVQVKIMRLFKNKQRCCSNEAGCCCEFGCTVCLF